MASQFNTDGVRPHSAAQRTLGNLRLGWVGDQDTLTLLLNSVNQPAQDPLGLTRAQFDADPYQTTPQATLFDTRKTAGQTQGGATWRHRFADHGALSESVLTAYAGQRDRDPVAVHCAGRAGQSAPPRRRDRPGPQLFRIDARLVWRWDHASLIAGVATEQQSEDRRGFENFVGSGDDRVLGVTGALRRDESNSVRSSDLYLQGEIDLGAQLADCGRPAQWSAARGDGRTSTCPTATTPAR